jgi:hypothetical protein
MILLLGINDVVEEYAENVLKIDMRNDIAYYPSVTTHYIEFGKYVDIVREEKPPVITTQSLEMTDVLLESDLDFEVVTVRRCDNEIKSRTLTKEEALDCRNKFNFEPRL